MTKPASELIALQSERAELMAKNAAATSWGAAVGARHERIKEIDGLLAANQSGSERAGVDALREALNIFVNCAYPVSGGIDPRGYNWSEAWLDQAKPIAEAALATPPAQPAPSKCEDCSGSGLALNSAGEPDICKTCGGNTVVPSEAPSTHGKPDGAVREALEPFVRIAQLLDEDRAQPGPDSEIIFKLPGYRAVHITLGDFRRAATALHSPKIAAAETGPGDAPQITMSDIRAHVGDGMVSSDDVIAAANALLRKHWAVTVKSLEWDDRGRADVYAVRQDSMRVDEKYFMARGDKILGWFDDEGAAKAAAQADYEQRIRSALIHPTTKPEAPASTSSPSRG